jgi:hypothetical protein
MPISRKVLAKDKNMAMKYRSFFKRERFNQNKIKCRKVKIVMG